LLQVLLAQNVCVSTSAGNVGIGTSAPSSRLEISSAGDDTNVIVMSQGSGYKNSIQNHHSGTASNARMSFFVHDSSTTQANVMSLLGNGYVGIGTTTPSYELHVSGDIYATGSVTASSSAAAKDNINTIPNALDLVEQLRGVTFKWKESGKKAVGLIYEEVKEVIPELTSEKEGHVGVAYQNTVALLIEAVKTLSAKVKQLESK
jgi:trimeric autotransporter adhesin